MTKKWATHELLDLGTDSDRRVAKRLGRTARAVERKRQLLRIPPHKNHKPFTRQEDSFLTANIGCETAMLARALERSVASVRARMRRLADRS